jgi:diguanylate cyclase (GGDEF)-like protein/PAS domain S-box-containing protein
VEKKILRVLIVDDSPDDTELAVAALRQTGCMLKHQRVQDLASMQTALDKGTWDAVVSEFSLPHFGAQLALDLIKRANLDIPFMVLTRSIKDSELAKIMRNGAHDVVMKTQTARLAPALERELRVAEERRLYRVASHALTAMETKNRAIIDGSREAICYCQDGMHIDANKVYLELFGYENFSDLEGIPLLNLVDKNDHPLLKEYLRKPAAQNAEKPHEFLALKNDGSRFHAELAVSSIVLDGENCTQVMVTDVSKRKAVENRLQYLSQHDPLTGLFNRTYFTLELNKVLDQAKKDNSQNALLYLDLQQLKEINDALGHTVGDRLLLKVARVFREKLGESAILARFSGDEFAALLHGQSEPEIKEAVTSLLTTLKEMTLTEGGKTFKCDGTVGLAVIDKHTESTQAVLTKAYQACQQSKPKKAAQTPPPPPPPEPRPEKIPATEPSKAAAEIPALTPVANEWQERLRTALKTNGFQLAYQPIINLHGDPAEYFEVLLRLVGNKGELISAGEFMPAAEKLGLTSAIDRWVVRHAIESLAALHAEKRKASFFVNLCPSALKDPELLALLQKQLTAMKVKPKYLVLEADEPAIAAHPADAAMFMQALKKIGCRFSMDNFGNNLAMLNKLRDLPVDFLKISGTLIRNLSTDNISQASLKAAIELAKAMNKQTIAKLVEKAEDLGVLWNLGVDYVQGNYFQQADAHLSYEFASETTLSSETSPSPNWASGGKS